MGNYLFSKKNENKDKGLDKEKDKEQDKEKDKEQDKEKDKGQDKEKEKDIEQDKKEDNEQDKEKNDIEQDKEQGIGEDKEYDKKQDIKQDMELDKEEDKEEDKEHENNIIENENKSKINLMSFDCLGNLIRDSIIGYMDIYDFEIFKSINGKLYLVYTNEKFSIVFYDLKDESNVTELKISGYLFYPKYFYDKINNRDLILTVTSVFTEDIKNTVKIWDLRNLECLLELKEESHKDENGIQIYNACLLYDNNQNYIITIIGKNEKTESIKVFDFNGNMVKEINLIDDVRAFTIDTYYDAKLSKNFIITLNHGSVKSYDFSQNKVYQIYNDNNNWEIHYGFVIHIKDDIVKLIESSETGIIRIWNFHNADLLNKININTRSFGICLWDENYLVIACNDKGIRILDLNTGEIIRILKAHILPVLYVKKVILPYYGECLISKDAGGIVKLWEKD